MKTKCGNCKYFEPLEAGWGMCSNGVVYYADGNAVADKKYINSEWYCDNFKEITSSESQRIE